MDFLGLRTLTTLTRAIELEHKTRTERPQPWVANQTPPPLDEKGHIDVERVDLTDKNVYGLFCRGETKGIFQFESGGMQDLLMKMQPDRIGDLIAANALYRPGPMELIPLYCNRKHGKEAVAKVHPIMDAILEDTYSIMVFQEQVMQIFNQLGGIELSAAYKLIKAISKKQGEVIAKFRPEFLKGAQAKGLDQKKADEIFELILKFGGYGFNRSHSARYAIIAFQTAYMKAYHPVEYMAALLTFEMGSTDKVVEYIEECRRMTLPDGTKGIRVLPPDVNISDKDFTPVYVDASELEEGGKKRKAARGKPKKVGVIRFGLMAVRGVGEKAVEAIIEERTARGPFTSLYDFCERVDLRTVARATIEALVKCGAFSSMGRRSQLLQVLDAAVESGQSSQQDKRAGQIALFGGPAAGSGAAAAPSAPPLPDVDELPDAELLKFEKELLGLYITSHPLTEHQSALEHYSTSSSKEAQACSEGTEVTIGGMITRLKKVITKNGRSAGMPMAIITLEDLEGQIDGTLFAETFAEVTQKYPNAVAAESIVFVRGKVDRKRETPSLLVNEVIPVSEAVGRLTTAVALKLDPVRHSDEAVGQLEPVLKKHKGNIEVYLQVSVSPSQKVTMRLDRERFVRPSRDLVEDLELALGGGSVQLCGAGTKRRKRVVQQSMFEEAGEGLAPAEATVGSAPASDEAAAEALDAEMEAAEAV
jgi:DNA polymerase III subunit alpha